MLCPPPRDHRKRPDHTQVRQDLESNGDFHFREAVRVSHQAFFLVPARGPLGCGFYDDREYKCSTILRR